MIIRTLRLRYIASSLPHGPPGSFWIHQFRSGTKFPCIKRARGPIQIGDCFQRMRDFVHLGSSRKDNKRKTERWVDFVLLLRSVSAAINPLFDGRRARRHSILVISFFETIKESSSLSTNGNFLRKCVFGCLFGAAFTKDVVEQNLVNDTSDQGYNQCDG